MELRTERLVLREFCAGDLEDVHAYAADPEVSRHMPWGPNTRPDTEAFLAERLAERQQDPRLLITLAVVGEPMADAVATGVVGAVSIGRHARHRAELAYTFNRRVWGRGYATEAAGALLRWAFDTAGLHRVEATCRPENTASARVLEKLGMRREGLLRGHVMIDGTPRDSYLYAVLRPDRRG